MHDITTIQRMNNDPEFRKLITETAIPKAKFSIQSIGEGHHMFNDLVPQPDFTQCLVLKDGVILAQTFGQDAKRNAQRTLSALGG